MITLTPWIHLIITGFVYVVLVFFVFLIVSRQYKLDSFKNVSHWLPYIAVLSIFISYVFGLVMHNVVEYVVVMICSKHSYDAVRQFQTLTKLPSELYEAYSVSYRDLVMIRHLIIGLAFLGPTFSFWLFKASFKRFIKPVLLTWLFLMVLFVGAYRIERESHIRSMSAIDTWMSKPAVCAP